MTEMVSKIVDILNEMGAEKLNEVSSLEALAALLKEHGVEASPAEVEMALQAITGAGKMELDEGDLSAVAGGGAVGAAGKEIVKQVAPMVLEKVGGWLKDKIGGEKKEAASAAPAAPAGGEGGDGGINQSISNTTNTKSIIQNNVNQTNTVGNITFN